MTAFAMIRLLHCVTASHLSASITPRFASVPRLVPAILPTLPCLQTNNKGVELARMCVGGVFNAITFGIFFFSFDTRCQIYSSTGHMKSMGHLTIFGSQIIINILCLLCRPDIGLSSYFLLSYLVFRACVLLVLILWTSLIFVTYVATPPDDASYRACDPRSFGDY